MKESKVYLGAFFVGGCYAAIGQVFLMLYTSILGSTSPFLLAAVLVSMGGVALVTYTTGLHQRISKWSGWGSILVFNGFACAVADTYETAAKRDGVKAGLISVADLVLWVVGPGAMLSIIIGIASFYLG